MLGYFRFYLDGIEVELTRKVGRMGSRDMIRREGSYWFSTPRLFFACLCFFVGIHFHTKTRINHTLAIHYCNCYSITTAPPKSTTSSPVVNVKEGMEMTKQTKAKIGVGSVVKADVGELEKITR